MDEAAPQAAVMRPHRAVPLADAGRMSDDVQRSFVMGPYTAKVWRDDVQLMESILARIATGVSGLRWIKPTSENDGHVLAWDGGRHQEERLGDLCDWANAEWPP